MENTQRRFFLCGCTYIGAPIQCNHPHRDVREMVSEVRPDAFPLFVCVVVMEVIIEAHQLRVHLAVSVPHRLVPAHRFHHDVRPRDIGKVLFDCIILGLHYRPR